MRTPTKISWLALLILPFLFMAAYAATLSTTSVVLLVGGKAVVSVTNIRGTVALSNSSPGVVSASFLNNSIQLTGLNAGTATVSVKDNSGTKTLAVTVKAPMTVSPTSLSLPVGTTGTLSISNTFTTSITVTSSNTGVATVSRSGNTVTVKAIKIGTASLTIRDSKTTLTVPVTVRSALSVSPESLTLKAGSSSTLSVMNASGTISVNNSDFSVISYTLTGTSIKVTGIKSGSATLTVKDSYGFIIVPVVVTQAIAATGYTLVAWNDLGMHCMDADYSIFSILPPFNNLHAQLVNNSTGKLVNDPSIVLTYEAMADPAGSVNSYSAAGPVTKTNFWDYVQAFFGGDPGDNIGLTGNPTASYTPHPLAYNATNNWFEATGIPITPYDDVGNKNTYPMVKVVAKDTAGNQLATARVVLPVSDEMSCTSCHASNSKLQDAKPAGGWVTGQSAEREYRLNILRLHDEKSPISTDQLNEVNNKYGFSYSSKLEETAGRTPILCAACHGSNALPGTGITGVKPLTESMHAKHSTVIDPTNGLPLESSSNRSSCYQCHPGSTTKCLRGVMGNAKLTDGSLAMQCQSCHGTMSKVGASGRVGWLEQPNCQACHHDSKREVSALATTGKPKTWAETTDTRFATNPNTPMAEVSLYRFSSGHGGLQCEACHGATHAEYPSSHVNDNLLAVDTQGYVGTIGECKSCHKTEPFTIDAGPHGMHTLGQSWVTGHHDAVKGIQSTCTYCHGADYRGSPLSTVKTARTFNIGDGRTKAYTAGQKVGCYDCHNGPTGG